jgi:glycosyltransferase involved in cell wall biosynthesis
MRIIISAIQVPFITGGADFHIRNLFLNLKREGHEVEVLSAPFKFFPEFEVEKMIDFWLNQDFESFSGYGVDKLIALQFPAYYAKHRNKAVWIMHQHRAVYDAYDEKNASIALKRLREKIIKHDTEKLSQVKKIFCNSQNVANRLKRFNGLESIPLYHPPHGEDQFYYEEPYNYIFYPSRLESLKRQDLLIQAMQYTKTSVKAIISGMGGQLSRYQEVIETLGLEDKVRMIGYITEDEKFALYARCLAVFFGPHDEDYGYVTLEAMLSQKPVITCTDSGGPLEFIIDGENGFIIDPEPQGIAEKIDWLYHHRQRVREMGRMGLELYRKKEIIWAKVVSSLLEQ